MNTSDEIDDQTAPIPFTARIIAYQRARERKNKEALIDDPFAEELAGDLTAFLAKHPRYSEMDYPIVRAYYLEKELLKEWCEKNRQSQIVLLGAGLDTRAYRFTPLAKNDHIVFEIDFPEIIEYKKQKMKDKMPICQVAHIAADLQEDLWSSLLLKKKFQSNKPTFWIFDGLAYYLEKVTVSKILQKVSSLSMQKSELFMDICVPALANLQFGSIMRHFKWGMHIKDIPSYYQKFDWQVNCSYADKYDQGRDVGQRAMIFIHGNYEGNNKKLKQR